MQAVNYAQIAGIKSTNTIQKTVWPDKLDSTLIKDTTMNKLKTVTGGEDNPKNNKYVKNETNRENYSKTPTESKPKPSKGETPKPGSQWPKKHDPSEHSKSENYSKTPTESKPKPSKGETPKPGSQWPKKHDPSEHSNKIKTPDGKPAKYVVKPLKAKTSEDKIREELKAKAAAKPAAKKASTKKAGK
jgi:hypothetical protein